MRPQNIPSTALQQFYLKAEKNFDRSEEPQWSEKMNNVGETKISLA